MLYKIQNKYTLGLAAWLNELELSGRDSRYRTRFVNILRDRVKEYQTERRSIISQFVEIDKDGKFKTRKEEGVDILDVKDDDREKLETQLQELEEEEFVVKIDVTNKNEFETVKKLVLDTDYKFGPGENTDELERQAKIRQADDYNEWCKTFE